MSPPWQLLEADGVLLCLAMQALVIRFDPSCNTYILLSFRRVDSLFQFDEY